MTKDKKTKSDQRASSRRHRKNKWFGNTNRHEERRKATLARQRCLEHTMLVEIDQAFAIDGSQDFANFEDIIAEIDRELREDFEHSYSLQFARSSDFADYDDEGDSLGASIYGEVFDIVDAERYLGTHMNVVLA